MQYAGISERYEIHKVPVDIGCSAVFGFSSVWVMCVSVCVCAHKCRLNLNGTNWKNHANSLLCTDNKGGHVHARCDLWALMAWGGMES